MKTILFSGIAAAGLLMTATQASASDSSHIGSSASDADVMQPIANGRKGGSSIAPGIGMPKPAMPHMGGMKPGGHHVGFQPRPGYHGIPRTDVYRRPHRGFILPRYWVQPTFYLSNFGNYGLSAPVNGYYWSRYYDDAVLTDDRGYVQEYRSDIEWNDGDDRTGDYREPEYGPSIHPDANVYNWNDNGKVLFAGPDGSTYSYDGEWEGKYIDPQGRVFEGEWTGRVTRHDGASGPDHPAPAPHHTGAGHPGDDGYGLGDERRPTAGYGLGDERRPTAGYGLGDERRPTAGYGLGDERGYAGDYAVPHGYENYERCLKSNGLTGAAIGALLGGFAGNRIAGHGNRTGGALIGAGVGGILGVAAEKANDKCSRHRPRNPHPYPGYGWQGGYYYYPQAPMVTVTVIPGASYTTTTVTEEVYYETVKTYPRKKAVRKWKPKPKPRCTCR
jgi:Ni/Co efflux regulator RcnB